MSRALLALALGLVLGNPAAPLTWVSSLVDITLSSPTAVGGQEPTGGAVTGDRQPNSDFGSQWDPDG